MAKDRIPNLRGLKHSSKELPNAHGCLLIDNGRLQVLNGTDNVSLTFLFLKPFNPANLLKYPCKQRKSKWNGSLWSISSGTTLFWHSVFDFVPTDMPVCNNGHIQIKNGRVQFTNIGVNGLISRTLINTKSSRDAWYTRTILTLNIRTP